MVGIMTPRQRDMIENDQIEGHDPDTDDKIAHLVAEYHWSWWQAMEHLYYHEHDPIDWVGSRWEEPCSLPPC
jgi:hypothetical protein